MRSTWIGALLVVFASSYHASGAGAEKSAPQTSRETPTVLAVRKVRDSIVSLKVAKPNARKDVVGTGVLIDERGYLVTNRHVVSGATKIRVTLYGGETFDGEVDFEEPNFDLAVVKIDAGKKLKPLPLGPTNDLMVGEEVIAIGHPFGYVNTVSRGIISALGREIEMPGGVVLKGLIQTNADINPGNSGGPLLNINGEWIGVNVALRQDAQGIAFALTAETVKDVLSRRLSASKKLGLYHGLDVRDKVLPDGEDRQKAVVHEVSERTPAAAAGFKEGDEIIRLGDYAVSNRFDVERALWGRREGDKVSATVLRQGQQVKLQLSLERHEEKKPIARGE